MQSLDQSRVRGERAAGPVSSNKALATPAFWLQFVAARPLPATAITFFLLRRAGFPFMIAVVVMVIVMIVAVIAMVVAIGAVSAISRLGVAPACDMPAMPGQDVAERHAE